MKQAAIWVRVCTALVAAAAVSVASAQAPDHGYRPGGRAPEHMDARFHHNHYYPNRGAYVAGLPGHPYAFERPGGRFFYSGGVWYAPYGPRFVVVGAPLGVFVPVLPPFYSTIWFGGVPYYYANDTYYVWSQAQNGYEVVAPPGDPDDPNAADSAAPPQPPPPQGDNLYIYPQQGQSAEQQASDQYECHKWSSSQTGFDPTQPAGGVPAEQLGARRADYQRAMIACLEGRGYSAR
ncbi:MAG TPA: DUF6515 family protein [Steroidobacteraceae bacterium]|nr:DUF6515 family protein [Steroidobacteraceae bacterium]